jgi:hypothetical protein
MVQKRPPKKRPPEEIDFTKSTIMAVIGVLILVVLFYFFNGAKFPSEISYEHLKIEL